MNKIFVIKLGAPLAQEEFDKAVSLMLDNKNSPFKLWGHPIKRGPTKIHVYGAFTETYTPVDFEFNERAFIAHFDYRANDEKRNQFNQCMITAFRKHVTPNFEAFEGSRKIEVKS